MKIPRNTGRDVDDPYQPEIEHLGICPICGALVDMRDLGQVLAHVHDTEIELIEGDGLPPRNVN
jgi:hypothetical protein